MKLVREVESPIPPPAVAIFIVSMLTLVLLLFGGYIIGHQHGREAERADQLWLEAR